MERVALEQRIATLKLEVRSLRAESPSPAADAKHAEMQRLLRKLASIASPRSPKPSLIFTKPLPPSPGASAHAVYSPTPPRRSSRRFRGEEPALSVRTRRDIPAVLAWSIERFAFICESTNGKDKLLKLIQCVCKLSLGGVGRALRQRAAAEISSARKLFRLGRTVHNLHWIRLILLGDDGGERKLTVRALRLTAFLANGLWFLCDHSVWLTALRRATQNKPNLVDPLLSVNRICAVVMQGALMLLNLRKVFAVVREIARTHYSATQLPPSELTVTPRPRQLMSEAEREDHDAQRERELHENGRERTAAILVREQVRNLKVGAALLPHMIKNTGDLISCWDFGFQLGLPKPFVNAWGIAASVCGTYR